MQISAPVHAQSSPGESAGSRENAQLDGVSGDSALWGRKARRKGKAGVFGKLLEGLISKTKGEPLSKPGNKNRAGPENVSATGDAVDIEKVAGIEGSAVENASGIENAAGIINAAESVFSPLKSLKNLNFAPETLQGNQNSEDFDLSGPEFSPDSNVFSAEFGSFRGLRRGKELPDLAETTFGTADFSGEGIAEHFPGAEGEGLFPESAAFHDEKKSSGTGNQAGRERRKIAPTEDFHAVLAGNDGSGLSGAGENGLVNSRNAGGAESESLRSRELRSRRGKERPNIEIRDLRTGEDAESGGPEVSKGQLASLLRPDSAAETEITVTLDGFAEKGDPASGGKSGPDISPGRYFEDALAREIRGNLSADIVRDAALIIRNGGEGTIRLSLRPDSLGNVKIRLEMAENKITGHIIVESNEALRAFERELPVLEKAFRDSGFNETSLEMSLSQDGGNFGNPEQRRDTGLPAYTPLFAASRYEAETDWVNPSSDTASAQDRTALSALSGRKAVNMLV